MTFLLYALLAWAATAAAARWVLPLRARARWALALLPLVATGAPLLSGEVMAPIDLAWGVEPLASARAEWGVEPVSPGVLHDVHTQMIPWRKAVRWAFAAGEWPLANPFMLAGDPLAPSAVPAAWHPVNLLALLLPLPQSYTFAAAATLLTAALAMFLLARDAGCREEVALVAAAGWAYSSYVGFWLGWPQGPAAAVTPLFWLGARRAAREPGVGSAGLLAAGGLLRLLGGHPESTFFAVVGGGALFLFDLAARRPRRLRAALAAALGGGLAALALAAIDLFPFVDALGQTAQHAQRSAIFARVERAAPLAAALENLRPNVIPFVHGVEGRRLEQTLRGLHAPAATTFAGGLLLVAALHGLARGRGGFRFALAGLALGGALLAVRFPYWVDLFRRLPLFDISLPEYGYLWAAPAVVLLGALGLERGLEPPERRRFAAGLGLAALLLGAATVALLPEMAAAGLDAAFAGGEALWLLAPLVAAALVVALAPPRVAVLLLLALLLVERRAELGHLYRAFPERLFYPAVAPLDRLPRGAEPYRVVGVHYALLPNLATMWELEDVRGYNAMTLARFAETLPIWSSQAEYWFNRVDWLHSFLSLLNVRYALAPTGFAPAAGWREIDAGGGWVLFENERVLPRAFVPREARFGAGAEERLAELAKASNFRRRAWIEPEGDPAPAPAIARNGFGEVTRVERRGSGYRIRTELSAPAWVVVSTPAWRGWRAESDGRLLAMGIADHAFVAFLAPAGEHETRLVFRPRAFDLGLATSAAALAGLAAVLALRWRRARRREATSS